MLVLLTNASGQPTGEILFEYWMDIGGTAVSDLTGQATYPDSPDDGELRTALEGKVDWADNYGTRVRGYLYPPEDGDYTLWISGDDYIELYLSTDDDPANAAMIAEVPGWTSYLEWNKYPEQQSAPITLAAAQKYYIEVAMKEGGGGDSLTAAWTGPGIGTELTVIDGAFLSSVPIPVALLKASDPVPADGAVDADVTALEWAAGPTAVSHTVYLSTDETIDAADLLGTTDLTIQIAILDPGVTYYWRVDETDADGVVGEGNVWSFSTVPLEAHFPSPADGASSQGLDSQLSWTAGKVVIMHDMYFGTDEAAIAARDMTTFKGKLMTTSYDPGALEIETTYYWAVDQFTPTGTVAGPVWSFTTIGSIAITDPDLLLYYDFELGEGSIALDQSGHSNHGQFKGSPQWVDGAVSIDIATLDYIETAAPLNIVSNTVSVTGWVKHDELPAGWSGILTHRGTSPGCLGLQHDGTELRYMWGADVYWSFSSGLPLPVGEWYFAALTISPDQGKLYLNGVEQTATNVAPHEPTNFDSLIRVGRDHNDGRIMTSLIDEVRFYNRTLTDADIQGMLMSDVTAPGDVVQGDPNEPRDGSIAGWPDGEYPWMATDDDVSTKFLHFRGEVSPTGFVVEPAMGPTIVTGMTFTTANDAPERDPASYELSGSNESIDGPYELIASGDLVDFTQADAWPRFTMNATAISFENEVAYKYYQVMFPTVRDAGSANSMQIAEVELLGVASPLVAHWTLDGDALDSSGYGNDGVLMGDPQWVEGIVGGALEFDGVDDFIDCGNSPVLAITGDITVACWIKVAQFDKSWQAIVTTGDSSWRVHRSSGSDNVAWGTSGLDPTDLTGTVNVNDAQWHHIAGVYNGSQKLLYIDGVLDASADSTGNINASTYNVNIGENNQATGRYFNGLIDDVRIYNQALSAAEIDRIANPPQIAWVSYHAADDEPHADAAAFGFTQAPDIEYTDLLKAQGYEVVRVLTSQTPDVEFLNTMDLVIISRTASSGHYSGSGASLWNSVTTPTINLNGYTLRNSRMGFTTGGTMVDTTGDVRLTVTDSAHPIFAGIALTDGTMDNLFAEGAVPLTTDETILSRGISINNDPVEDEGIVLATIAEASADTGPVGGMMIAEYPAGATMENSSGSPTDVLGGPRLVFLTGSREPSGVTGGQAAALYDLFEDGTQMFLNAVAYMLPSPGPVNILANGGLEDDLTGAGWGTYGDASMEVVTELVDAAVPDVPIEGSNCLHVTVNSAGANFWDAGLQHGGHVFEAGKSYTLSVWFKSKAGPFQINIKPERAADPWDGYGSQEITITEEWDVYAVNTGVIADTVDPASITFHIAYAPGEFWVDDAVFTED